jgi:tellurite resistance protein TehA-like permease
MATGIVAIAARQQGFVAPIAHAALATGVVAWLILAAATVLRIVTDRPALQTQLRDHGIAPGFFTAVAGTGVLAANLLQTDSGSGPGIALALLTALLWAGLTYGIFAALITRADKPPFESGLNGSWLLAVVATQSVAVVCALAAPLEAQPLRLALNFVALGLWLFGGMLYTWIIVLIFYRYLFFRFAPADLTPAYWINMGAMAISTLAGSLLAARGADAPFLHSLAPFVQGFTILYWATATWWLPMLAALTLWRYAVRRDSLDASAVDWSMVFPLGMYSAATDAMAGALGLPFLAPVAAAFCWLALAAWAVTAAAHLRTVFVSRS